MATSYTALIVEDQPQIIYTMKPVLRALGFLIDTASTLERSSQLLAKKRYDLLILDRQLPDGDGLELFSVLEELGSSLRTIVLSIRATTDDRVFGLNKGADDYLAKPFSSAELSARIKAVMKRSKRLTIGKQMLFNGAEYDYDHHLLTVQNEAHQLSPTEARLFELFLRHPTRRITREHIATSVWTFEDYPSSTTVDVCIKRLRMKLEHTPFLIQTIRHVGYQLETPPLLDRA